MAIERKVVQKLKRRDKDELISKHKKIGKLLGLELVPVHTLAWKEPRLELDTADCYPVVDVLERVADLLFHSNFKEEKPKKKPGRPKTK